MTSAIERRLIALEQRAAVATCAIPEPVWIAEHGCMMQNCYGFVLPMPISEAEWEQAAKVQQAKLTGQA
jgi:hypothetical protein